MNIRKATLEDTEGIVRVHIDTLKRTHIGILTEEFLNNLNYEWSSPRFTETLSNPKRAVSLYVAENEEKQIIGFIWGGPERRGDEFYKGEIYAIYVLPEYQGVGIGKRLVKCLVLDLISHGINSMLVMVFADNLPSRHFYEKIGGQIVSEGVVNIMGIEYRDVVYGWSNNSIVN